MNNPNPFVPKGSLLEQQSQRRSRLKLAVFCVVLVSVTGLVAMLIQGCKREQPANDMTENPTMPIDTGVAPPDTNPYVVTPPPMTNPPPAPIVVPPAPVPPAPLAAAGSEYTVVSGDTLGKIAKAHGVSLKALEDANPGVDSRKLQINQKLVIPAPTTPATGSPTTMNDTSGETYVVKSGDTLTKIAKAHGTTIKAIEAANPNVDPNHIKVNQKLIIPGKAEAAAPAPAPVETAPAPSVPMPVLPPPGMTN